MSGESIFVVVGICVMVALLLSDRMRPGITLLMVAITFMAAGAISADELISGFSNKGVITVAMRHCKLFISATLAKRVNGKEHH